MEMDEEFEGYLHRSNLADNTVKAYMYAVKQYCSKYDKVTKSNLQKYKLFLLENYKPKTVNLRIRAINCYLEVIGKEKLVLSSVKVQQKTFLENVISDADYMYFKECLRKDGEWFWYFVIRFMAATGARVQRTDSDQGGTRQYRLFGSLLERGKNQENLYPERLETGGRGVG